MPVYIGFGLLLYLAQDSFLYHPTTEVLNTNHQSIRLQSDNETLKVWVLNPNQSHTIIYFGGNGEDTHNSLSQFRQMFPKHTVYAMNYRGYGGSTGLASQEHLFKDAITLYDHIKDKHQSISTVGRSLGSGIATYLATQRNINKLVLITPYDSIMNVAQQTYPVYPIAWLLRDHYNSLSIAGKLSSQTLILVAENDRVVPPAHAHNLASAIPDRLVTNITIPGVGHNSISASDNYQRQLSYFMSL